MAKPPSPEERDAYATGCELASRIADLHPDVEPMLRELVDAVRTEQRLATQRGRPVYGLAEEFADAVEEFVRMGPKDPAAGAPREEVPSDG